MFRPSPVSLISAPMAVLVHREHNLKIQSGRLAQKTPRLFKTTPGVLFQMFGRFEVLEGEFNVHKEPPGKG